MLPYGQIQFIQSIKAGIGMYTYTQAMSDNIIILYVQIF